MQAILLSREEVAQRAEKLYESRIRQEVEVEENIARNTPMLGSLGSKLATTLLPLLVAVLWSV